VTALTADRNTPERQGALYDDPVAADVRIFAGALVVLDASGNAAPGSTATGLIARGRAQQAADNTDGLAGAVRVPVQAGVFHWRNSSAGDAIGRAEIGSDCFIVDDQTVAKTDGTGTRSKAGTVVDVDGQGVWVSTGLR
jgi:hypothetical protein